MVPLTAQARWLGLGALGVSALFWIAILVLVDTTLERLVPDRALWGTVAIAAGGAILTYAALGLARGYRVAQLRGHAVEIGPKQFPDLYQRLKHITKKLELARPVTAYLVAQAPLGVSLSQRGWREDVIALPADLVGAASDHPGALDFLIGFELGLLAHPRERWRPWLAPAEVLPLLGPALARERIHSADRYAFHACRHRVDPALAVALWVSGPRRVRGFHVASFTLQTGARAQALPGFMQLVSGQPWMSERMAWLRAQATESAALLARRAPLAYLAAVFVPYLAWRSDGRWRRAVAASLWAVVAIILAQAAVTWWRDAAAPVAAIKAPTPKPASAKPAANSAELRPDRAEAQAHLDEDLRRLGELAEARFRKMGGNPCEVGDIQRLLLYYKTERYAFSCNEPLVYTMVEASEFEPGRPSYIRAYHWKEKQIVPMSSAAPLPAGPAGPP